MTDNQSQGSSSTSGLGDPSHCALAAESTDFYLGPPYGANFPYTHVSPTAVNPSGAALEGDAVYLEGFPQAQSTAPLLSYPDEPCFGMVHNTALVNGNVSPTIDHPQDATVARNTVHTHLFTQAPAITPPSETLSHRPVLTTGPVSTLPPSVADCGRLGQSLEGDVHVERRSGLTDEDWLLRQPIIKYLYFGKNMPLKTVVQVMKETHSFDAT